MCITATETSPNTGICKKIAKKLREFLLAFRMFLSHIHRSKIDGGAMLERIMRNRSKSFLSRRLNYGNKDH